METLTFKLHTPMLKYGHNVGRCDHHLLNRALTSLQASRDKIGLCRLLSLHVPKGKCRYSSLSRHSRHHTLAGFRTFQCRARERTMRWGICISIQTVEHVADANSTHRITSETLQEPSASTLAQSRTLRANYAVFYCASLPFPVRA